MNSIPALFLSLLCIMTCAGCGLMRTEYDFSPKVTARQKEQIVQVVDSTAHRCNFGVDTKQMEEYHQNMGGFFRAYSKNALSIMAEDTCSPTYVFLAEDSKRSKSPDFLEVEGLLTPAFRKIDPHLIIHTGYCSNPMM